MKSALSLFILSTVVSAGAFGQVISSPSFGLKSHETMEVVSVESGKDKTTIKLAVENRAISGYFCVDHNTFIVLPDGSRLKLREAEGIPHCPQVHNFKRVGEVIKFSLIFPPLPSGTDWFDLIEDCSENCFSVFGLTLDNGLNEDIEEAYVLSESGKPAEAAAAFTSIISSIEGTNHGILGSLYSSGIVMFLRNGDELSAKKLYDSMSKADMPNKNLYINNLNSRGIKW